jgi:outer membrane usher protein FimD/PapC
LLKGHLCRILCLACMLAFCLLGSARAEDPIPPADTTEISTDGEFSAFDFYVGGNYYGIVYGYFGDDWFKADKPADFMGFLPAVKNRSAFPPLFEGKIIKEKTLKGVGTVQIDTGKFRVNLEIDREQSLLSKVNELEELEATDKGTSLYNKIFMAGSTETQKFDLTQNFSFTHNTIISKEKTSFLSEGTLTGQEGYKVTSAALRQDFNAFGQQLTADGGMLQTQAPKFGRSLDFFGLRVTSNKQLIFRDAQGQASNLEIFLPNRSKVEIYRQSESTGRVIFSRILDFGTVQIDTRSFPAGSYDIEIVTTDSAGVKTHERRPFTKALTLTPRGKPQIDIEAGVIRDDLKSTGTPAILVSEKKRIADALEGSFTGYITGNDQIYEVSFNAESSLRLLGALGMTTLSLSGAIDTLGDPAGIDASFTWTGDDVSTFIGASKVYARQLKSSGPGDLSLTDRQAINFNVTTPLMLFGNNSSFGFNAELSSTKTEGQKYHYGPVLDMKLPDWGSYSANFKLENVTSNDDNRTLATLFLRNDTRPWLKTGEVAALNEKAGTSLTSRAGISFAGDPSTYSDWRQNLKAGLNLRGDPLVTTEDQKSTTVLIDSDATYQAKGAKLQAYLNQNLKDSTGQLGGELASSVLWSKALGVTATGAEISPEDAFAVIKLSGTETNKISVTVNGVPRGYGYPGDMLIIPLPTYQKSIVNVVDQENKGNVKVKEKSQLVVSFPGNLVYREFTILKSYFVSGSLKDSTGQPLAGARFTLNGDIYYTDETGSFTFESALQENQDIAMDADGYTCNAAIHALPKDDILYDMGEITCKEKPRSP